MMPMKVENSKTKSDYPRDYTGNTALHYASFAHDHELISEILSVCDIVDVNASNDAGLTPLAAAFWDMNKGGLMETVKV